MKLIVKERLSI